jgi:septum formation inhibitor MinC
MSAQWLRYSPKRQKAKKPKATKANEKTQLTKARNPKTTKTRVENRKNPPKKKTNKQIILPNKPVAGGTQFLHVQTLIEFNDIQCKSQL